MISIVSGKIPKDSKIFRKFNGKQKFFFLLPCLFALGFVLLCSIFAVFIEIHR